MEAEQMHVDNVPERTRMYLHRVEKTPLGGVHGWTVIESDIDGESCGIFVGTIVFENPRREETKLSWRAVYKGVGQGGWTVSKQDEPNAPLHDAPLISLAVGLFIERQIAEYRTEQDAPLLVPQAEDGEQIRIKQPKQSAPKGVRASPQEAAFTARPRTLTPPDAEITPSLPEKAKPSIREAADTFRKLPRYLKVVATCLAKGDGEEDIIRSRGISGGALNTYLHTLRKELSSPNTSELRETLRELFRFDDSLRIVSEAPEENALSPEREKMPPSHTGQTEAKESVSPAEKEVFESNDEESDMERKAAVFRSLSERLRMIATYLADDAGTQQIADALGVAKDTLKGYFCQLRDKFSLGIPELRELLRALYQYDASLRSPLPKTTETTSRDAGQEETALPEQFGKEVLQTFSPQERAVAILLGRGLTLSQVASRTNLRLIDVRACKKKLKRYFRSKDEASLLLCLADIAAGKKVSIPPHARLGEKEGQPEHLVYTDEEEPAEFLQFASIMEAIEEFRNKLSRGYELTVGDCAVRPNGDVVSVSIRVRQSG